MAAAPAAPAHPSRARSRLVLGCGLAAALVALPGAASAGVPAWCATPGAAGKDSYSVKDAINGDTPRELRDLVLAVCYPDDEAMSRSRELEAALGRWSKRLQMTGADWADAIVWAAGAGSSIYDTEYALDDRGTKDGVAGPIRRAWSTLSALDQYAAVKKGLFRDSHHDYIYFTDALGSRLTETGRLAFIEKCLDSNTEVVEWAVCQGDIAALDRKQLAAELRADRSYTGAQRMLVRLQLDALDQRLAKRAADVARFKQRDPAYAKMFELASAARTAWDAYARGNAPLLELAAGMDDARATSSRKARAGCEAATWAAWRSAVAEIPAKRFEGIALRADVLHRGYLEDVVSVVAGTPSGYLASIALYICHADRQRDDLIDVIGLVLQRWPGFRGPRSAVASVILTAGLQLDDESAKIPYVAIYRPWLTGSTHGANAGTIASIKRRGATATITFAKKLQRQRQCAASRRTNRITQIDSSGNLVYESICTAYKTVTVDRSPGPQTVDARYVTHLKRGMNVLVGGVVFAAWHKGKSKPAVIAGVGVK